MIGVENIKSQNRKTTHSNLVLLDTLGNVIRDIVIAKKGQYIGSPFMSPSDSLLFFTTEVESEKSGGLSLFKRLITINVINFNNQALIKQMPDFCTNLNFDIQESPWSPDEKRFVYSIVNDREVREKGKPEPIKLQSNDGVYICNLNKDSHKRIADKGYFAVNYERECS